MMFFEMLYGKTPWTAKSPYQLFKNIKDIPLTFPEKPVTSDLVKDMLRKMLFLEGKIRIRIF
jgi:serine/threonine protein kinase